MLARVSAALLGVALFAGTACAQETTIKFTLGWKTQGSDAKDNGFFKEEGLNVVIDQGEGSGATVTRIMSGAYDAGFGDVNAIIQNASTRPQDAPVMVYMIWNQPPFAIVTKKTSGINTIKDFEGHTLGGAQGTPTTRLLPVFAQKNKLEGEKIKISNMAPNLQEPMLIKGDIDAALVFNITSYFNLVLNRQDPDKDYKWFQFGDYGLDLYSNGVMVSRKLLASNPKAVAGLVRAVNRGMIAIAKDQNAGMKAAVNRRRRRQGRPHGSRHRHHRRGLPAHPRAGARGNLLARVPAAARGAGTGVYGELTGGVSDRHCEERSDEAIHSFFSRRDGLLRCARNDGGWA
jgi:NitT/TauT family transport system substrate-binding protein